MKVTKTIEVVMMYECGRCGNSQRKTYVSDDGLLIVPKIYCGNCTKGRGLVPMSETFVSVTSSEKGDEEVKQFDSVQDSIADMKSKIEHMQTIIDSQKKETSHAVSEQLHAGSKDPSRKLDVGSDSATLPSGTKDSGGGSGS